MVELSNDNLVKDFIRTVTMNEFHAALYKAFRPQMDKTVLEVGSGSGKLALSYALNGCSAILLDIDCDCLDYSQRIRDAAEALLHRYLVVKFVIGDVHDMSMFQDDSVDFCFSEGVIEHWEGEERLAAVKEMVRVSREMVANIVPNALNVVQKARSLKTKHTYKGMPEKEHLMTPPDLVGVMADAGLKDIQRAYIWPSVNPPRFNHDYRYVMAYGVK